MIRSIFCALTLLLATTPIAQAQFGFGGDGEIDVKASEATYKGGITVLIGDVVVTQADSVITADKMTIYRAEEATQSKSDRRFWECEIKTRRWELRG